VNDGDALRAAIVAYPDEDTPRLMYADWLQENDQPERAEFIRSSIADPDGFTHAFPLGCAAQTIFHRDTEDLIVPILHASPLPEVSYTVRRGFVEAVALPASAWFTYGNTLRRDHPVTRVRLTTRPTTDDVFREFNRRNPTYTRIGEITINTSVPQVTKLLAIWWRGVTFELPEVQRRRHICSILDQ
jgi:uncharacterized protein (TIGR02996 family)